MGERQAGFTVVELLVTLLILGLVMAGLVGMLGNQTHMYGQQDQVSAMEQNLRVGVGVLTDALRGAGYGVPTRDLSVWVPWVVGFDSNPRVTSTTPQVVSVARCSPQPVARLSADATEGATTLLAVSAVPDKSLMELLDVYQRRLIFIDESENAHVTAVGTSSIEIDTDPLSEGNQGLENAYPVGTPLCRVDVLTFTIQTDQKTALPQFRVDENHGDGPQPVADGVSTLQVTTITPGERYQVSLKARTERPNPLTQAVITRTLRSLVTVRNGYDG